MYEFVYDPCEFFAQQQMTLSQQFLVNFLKNDSAQKLFPLPGCPIIQYDEGVGMKQSGIGDGLPPISPSRVDLLFISSVAGLSMSICILYTLYNTKIIF
tara:strand:- start:294 stop:590 length:297 start_codon:yes stop_codon:yes gene_type:complete